MFLSIPGLCTRQFYVWLDTPPSKIVSLSSIFSTKPPKIAQEEYKTRISRPASLFVYDTFPYIITGWVGLLIRDCALVNSIFGTTNLLYFSELPPHVFYPHTI